MDLLRVEAWVNTTTPAATTTLHPQHLNLKASGASDTGGL